MIRPNRTVHLSALPFIPQRPTLESLKPAADACQGCDLYQGAQQAVVGQGPVDAKLMMVGEVPGPSEDEQGQPFVGPAGQVFDRALREAGIERTSIFITNVVKHFRWKQNDRGDKLVMTPSVAQIRACLPWLETELTLVHPEGIVCLGATAAQALISPDIRVTRVHGQFFPTRQAQWIMATLHPSAVLRMPTPEQQERTFRQLVNDLKLAIQRIERPEPRRETDPQGSLFGENI